MTLPVPRPVRVIEGTDAASLPIAELIADGRPALLRGIAAQLPMVQAGLAGPQAAIDYLKRFDGGRPVTIYAAPAEVGGRFGYNDDCTALNFTGSRAGLSETLDQVAAALDDAQAPAIYIGSTDIDLYLPGLRQSDVLPIGNHQLAANPPLTSIWIGNRTTARAHFDMSNNIAVCMIGHRRFTLFPPDQVANLYPGPIDLTPAGQMVSLVDFTAPDLARHPRFADALAVAEVAEMQPGDAVIYPAMWWHQVEALDPFNAMINYWWNDVAPFIDTPMTTLLHGLLSLRGRPAHERTAWRALFEHFLFADPEQAAGHIPPPARGPLAPLDAVAARRLRAQILNKLNR